MTATSRMGELEQALRLLKGAEELQDETVRGRIQALILAELEGLGTPSVETQSPSEPTPPPPPPTQLPAPGRRTPTGRASKPPRAGTLRAVVLESVQLLATREKPLSVAELEGVIETPSNRLSATLSELYRDHLVGRVTTLDDVDRGGASRDLYKYYPL